MPELTQQDTENYSFLRLYAVDLEMAKQACDLCARQESTELRYCILRDIVVTYARPFSGNRGRVVKYHRLSTEVVPLGLRPLHADLLALRNQVFAHTDHEFRNPQIARWPTQAARATYLMSFANPAYDELLARLDEIRALAVAVESQVNTQVRDLEACIDQFFTRVTDVQETR